MPGTQAQEQISFCGGYMLGQSVGGGYIDVCYGLSDGSG